MNSFLTALSLLLLAAVPLPAATPTPPDADEALGILTLYQSAYNRQDSSALAALYAEDAILLPPDCPMIRGRQAIERFWRQSIRSGLRLRILTSGVSSDVAFVVGTYFFARGGVGGKGGKFTMGLKREPNGSWRIASDMWNQEMRFGVQPAREK